MKKCEGFETQKGTRYIRGNIYFGIIIFYQSFLLNEAGLKDIMNVSLNIPAKTETWFCRWKSTDNNNINIFLSLENPYAFLVAKKKTWKRIFNTNSKLSQNRTEKQVMPLKTTISWLFNDIWCYLVIGCFDWNTGVFQQIVVRGLLYP